MRCPTCSTCDKSAGARFPDEIDLPTLVCVCRIPQHTIHPPVPTLCVHNATPSKYLVC
uniref:LIM zinc-binding domain-containing protein n=1 Tax=Mesocestoides corti TaxID=53468 RepID=A0A5K3FW35_MESCO